MEDVGKAHGIAGRIVFSHGNGDEFHSDTIVLERVVQSVSVGDWDAGVTCVVENQRGCSDGALVGDGRLFLVSFRVLFFPGRAAASETL